MAELDPTTVWMVHLRKGDAGTEIKGTLAIEGDLLVFSDARDHQPVTFPFGTILKVKRLRSSPVLMVEWDWDGSTRRTAFYFAQPPPLRPPEAGMPGGRGDPFSAPKVGFGGIRHTGKRKHQRDSLRYLQTVGISKKQVIQAWADEVNARRDQVQG